jgi:hypothetical protein
VLRGFLLAAALSFACSEQSLAAGVGGAGAGSTTPIPAFVTVFPSVTAFQAQAAEAWAPPTLSELRSSLDQYENDRFEQTLLVTRLEEQCAADECSKLAIDGTPTKEFVDLLGARLSLQIIQSNIRLMEDDIALANKQSKEEADESAPPEGLGGAFGISLTRGGSGLRFAPSDEAGFPPDIALAYAKVLRARKPSVPAFRPYWSAWTSGFGGYNKTDVDSTSLTSRLFGGVTGLDYHYSRNTVFGVTLGGSNGTWSVPQGLGSGRSDSLQVGVSGKTHYGRTYVSAALGFSNNWMTTDRFAAGDEITARFSQQTYSGRLEAGYRYVTRLAIAVTPYAALQVQDFYTPNFSETDLGGGANAFAYNARNSVDTRSELGARFDNMQSINGMPLQLSARAAYAHDWITNPLVQGALESLPTAGLSVSPVIPPTDSALASASAELHITPAFSVGGQFYSASAANSQTFAGSASLRYAW